MHYKSSIFTEDIHRSKSQPHIKPRPAMAYFAYIHAKCGINTQPLAMRRGHVERHQLVSFDEVLLLQLPNESSLSASPCLITNNKMRTDMVCDGQYKFNYETCNRTALHFFYCPILLDDIDRTSAKSDMDGQSLRSSTIKRAWAFSLPFII